MRKAMARFSSGVCGLLVLASISARATVTIEPWEPLYQGVEHSVGRVSPGEGDSRYLVVHALRIDLKNPDVQLLTTPPITNYVATVRETAAQTISSFLQANQLQVAVNANFYSPSEVDAEGTAVRVIGTHISAGRVVSRQETLEDSTAFFFTTNKEVVFIPTNFPPTNNAGFYTAVSGHYAVVREGVSVANNSRSLIPGNEPRTLIGVDQEGRYLFLVTVDGRQSGYSEGCQDEESAEWMLRFGAYHAVNMDGGGSTTMVMSDCLGLPVRLNKPSYLLGRGRERYVGSHIGVYAKPLQNFISQVQVIPGRNSATVRWNTDTPATSQVEYGATTAYGTTTPLDSTPRLSHQILLEGLEPSSTNFFRILAFADGQEYSAASCFVTTNLTVPIFGLSQSWKYHTNRFDDVPWMKRDYDDSNWLGEGPGLLHREDNVQVAPRATQLPLLSSSPLRVSVTYYFRTHFNYSGAALPAGLMFSNFIDDGAVFYLNGVEVQRVRMAEAPTEIFWNTLSVAANPTAGCNGDALTTCPTIFSLRGDALTNLVRGDNLLAVEVHNFSVGSPDVVFGTALSYELGDEPVTDTAPTFTQEPVDQSVVVGDSVTFSTATEGTGPISYQWFFNQTPLPGVTGPSLTLTQVALGNAGEYRVIAANAVGSATSQVARLTVGSPATLQIVKEGDNIVVSWDQPGYFLQQAIRLREDRVTPWTNVTPAISTSPYVTTNSDRSRYFRLLR
jgi:hypothetical protein